MKPTNNIIFVNFKEVIKTADIAILEALKDERLKKQFQDIIDYTKFEYMDRDNLLRLSIQKSDKNILKYLGLKDNYNYDKLYKLLYDTIESKYIQYPPLAMVETLASILSSPAISYVYVYSEDYEDEIQTELGLLFNANVNKLRYIYGDLKTCLRGKDISLFIINDVDMIFKLSGIDELKYREVLLATYGYNYTLSDEDLVIKHDLTDIFIKSAFKLKMFEPFILTEKHISQFENNIDDNNNLSLG